MVTGDRLSRQLQLRGHFSGRFNGVHGTGQEIEFIAYDIQLIGRHRIVEDRLPEDSPASLTKAGLPT